MAETATVQVSDLHKLKAALYEGFHFFKHRDEMNARVHLSEPRYSPITLQAEAALNLAGYLLDNAPRREAEQKGGIDGRKLGEGNR